MRSIMLVVSAMVTVVLIQLFAVAPSALALSDTPDKTWNTNGTVFATALSEDGSTLYVGGKFTKVRETRLVSPAQVSPSATLRPSM